MNTQRKTQLLNRYTRVKNKIKNSMVDSDVNTYVKELIQAQRLKEKLITEYIRS